MENFEWITLGDNTKPAIIFLHGWGGGFASFMGVARALASQFFCVLINANPVFEQQKVVSMENFAQAFKNCVEKLNLEKFSVVGHSFGGRIISKSYESLKDKIDKIVLVDVAGIKPKRSVKYRLRRARYSLQKLLVKLKLASSKTLEKFGSADYIALDQIHRQSFSNIVGEDLTSQYRKISVPTLIFWGRRDKETPIYMAKKLNQIITDSGLVLVDGGHFSYLDAPQTFLAALYAFLRP